MTESFEEMIGKGEFGKIVAEMRLE